MKNSTPWWIRIPILFFLSVGFMELVINSDGNPAFLEFPIILAFYVLILIILISSEFILKAVENVMFRTLSKEAQERYLTEKSKNFKWKWGEKMYQKLLGSKPVEAEGEIILDHNYDGIKELDNSLPPWWKYLFYGTIVFAIVYLIRFEIVNDYNQIDEYESYMETARLDIEEYRKTAKDLVDVNSVVLLTDASDINAGKAIYNKNCVACHVADGGGGIGPNLTDENWILGGGIKNVFNTVSEGGRDGKGMVAWKQILKPAERAQVSSYVLTMVGTTPVNPKAAEGDIWVEKEE